MSALKVLARRMTLGARFEGVSAERVSGVLAASESAYRLQRLLGPSQLAQDNLRASQLLPASARSNLPPTASRDSARPPSSAAQRLWHQQHPCRVKR